LVVTSLDLFSRSLYYLEDGLVDLVLLHLLMLLTYPGRLFCPQGLSFGRLGHRLDFLRGDRGLFWFFLFNNCFRYVLRYF
jgi:hypothetical protein